MAKVQKGDDLDVRDPELFSEPIFLTMDVYSSWRVGRGAPVIRSAVRSVLCSLLISDFVAEPNQTVIYVHRTDSMTAE